MGFTPSQLLPNKEDDVTAINNLLDHVGLFFHSFRGEIDHGSTALFELNGKTALVTGADTGIGRMASTALGQQVQVFIASRKIDACRATADDINSLGFAGSVHAMQGDVATEDGIEQLINDLDNRTNCIS